MLAIRPSGTLGRVYGAENLVMNCYGFCIQWIPSPPSLSLSFFSVLGCFRRRSSPFFSGVKWDTKECSRNNESKDMHCGFKELRSLEVDEGSSLVDLLPFPPLTGLKHRNWIVEMMRVKFQMTCWYVVSILLIDMFTALLNGSVEHRQSLRSEAESHFRSHFFSLSLFPPFVSYQT